MTNNLANNLGLCFKMHGYESNKGSVTEALDGVEVEG